MIAVGLARYDAMCSAISACYSVDEVKGLRDKARALEVYAQQARNTEAECKAAEVRMRAERRAGELLKEMAQKGQRATQESNLRCGPKSRDTTSVKRLKDYGISRDQSSKWQRLAEVPADEFEAAVKAPGATTEGILNSRALRNRPAPRIDTVALWFWGRLCDFERDGLLDRDLGELVEGMPEPMRDDVRRIVPRLSKWLKQI